MRWNESRSFVLSVFEHLSLSLPRFHRRHPSPSLLLPSFLVPPHAHKFSTFSTFARFSRTYPWLPGFCLWWPILPLSPSTPISRSVSLFRSLYGNEDVLFVKRRGLPPLCFKGEAERGQRAAREIRFYPAAVAETFFPYLGITSKLE